MAKKTKAKSASKKAAPSIKTIDASKTPDTAKADTPKTDAPKADASKTDTPKTDAPKTEASDSAGDAPKNYSRGEGQKAVTQAYRDNWNAIFGKKKR